MTESNTNDLRRLFSAVDDINKNISSMNTTMQVYIASNNGRIHGIEKISDDNKIRLDKIEELKNKGMVFAILGFVLSGGMGGTAAHLARKFLE